MIAHLRITCATGISRLRGDPLLHPYRLPTTGSSLQIHPQLLPIFAFTYDMKYHSRIQNEMQGEGMKKGPQSGPFFIGFIGLTALRAGGFSPPFYCPTACGGKVVRQHQRGRVRRTRKLCRRVVFQGGRGKGSKRKVDARYAGEGYGLLTQAGCVPRGETTHYILCVAIAPIKCVRCASHALKGRQRLRR